jgi:DNA mismatch repair protein MutL
MQKIVKLPVDVIAKIAAGEVIERPAYAVKELIENAIDAHANSITITIEESGLRRIQVSDDGEGMSKEDVEIAFLPHTTSKINDEHELMSIKTLGFRGEALSSIAAISHMSIKSRTKNDPSGTIIEMKQGRVEHFGSVGTPPGTIVTVDELFSTFPARKKFLKTAKTEFRHITDVVLHFALSYPTIHFTLIHNKKTIFDLPAKNDERERLRLIFGDVLEHLLPFSFTDSYLTLSGYIGKPQIASKNNQRQFLFVNKRAVSDKLISLAVKESFGTLLPSSTTPVFSLHLTLPYEVVDVNVHPRKEQVSFVNARMIFDLVKQAVSETLTNSNIVFHVDMFGDSLRKGETTSFSGKVLKDIVLPWNRTDIGNISSTAPLIQIHQTYVLAVTKEGLLLIDQHAAHERILFEQFVKEFEKAKKVKKVYTLAKPIRISLSLTEKQIIDEYKQVFEDIGFSLEYFGNNTFLIRHIPVIFKGRRIEKIIKDMLLDLSESIGIKKIDITSKKMLAFLSCRAAVKSGDVLSVKQMERIVSDLEKTENNETCPHGRPTQIAFSLDLIHKYFKRI